MSKKEVSEEREGLRVIKASITNFKNIGFREVEFEGRSAVIAGPNQAGKSSLIQAIVSPLNSKYMPVEPIKKGEEKGKLELTVGGVLDGEQQTYVISTYFSPEHSRGRLVLENGEGAKISGGKSTLNEIIGDISFDVFEFIRLGRTDTGKTSEAGVKKQIELLKSFMPKESLRELHKLDQERLTKYNERTEINSTVKYIESIIKGTHYRVAQIEEYAEPKVPQEIMESIDKAKKINENIRLCEEAVIDAPRSIKGHRNEIEEAEAKIESLKIWIEQRKGLIIELEEKETKANAYLAKKQKIDLDPLYASLETITEHNGHVEKVKNLKEQEEQLKVKKKESQDITDRLAKIDQLKKDVFSSSTLPVPGLEFSEEQVLFEGLPFNEDQIPTSQLIQIGLKLGAALNPNLRLMVIKDGSLLDEKAMDAVLKFCEENNYQVLIEMVQATGEELSIEFIEK